MSNLSPRAAFALSRSRWIVSGELLRLAHDERPDLILLDLELPDGNGWNVAALVQTQFPGGGIPIVVISSRDEPAAKPVQVAAYFQKPTNFALLVARIHDLIGPPDLEAEITV